MSQCRFVEDNVLGPILIKGSSSVGLQAVTLRYAGSLDEQQSEDPLLMLVEKQLRCYLQGGLYSFADIPLSLEGTTFQKKVWQLLTEIPYGQTRSYGWMAAQLGYTSGGHAARAVGQANGRNPMPVIIPCHRVIQQGGKLGGYSASGGLSIKQYLLDLECQHLPHASTRQLTVALS